MVGDFGRAVSLIDTGDEVGRSEWRPSDKISGILRYNESVITFETLQEAHLEGISDNFGNCGSLESVVQQFTFYSGEGLAVIASGVSAEGGAGSPIKRGRVIRSGENQAVSIAISAFGPGILIAIAEVGNGGGIACFETNVLAAVSELSRIFSGDGGNANSVAELEGRLI